ncbi:MAG TPA: hypothetical protein VFJ58_16245 [Armatimonadota bacterium]|nr:hypothetical protein [Armatimonadota bacterium]
MRRPRDDFNNGWLSVVRPLLQYLFAFFFTDVHKAVDWDRPVEFLDKEMEYAVRAAGKGKKTVDTLVKVWLKSGEQAWMLIHLEFQNQIDVTFPSRMFSYNALTYIRHHVDVASFAILGDPSPSWRPDHFDYGAFGSSTGMTFQVVKLLDYRKRLEELERSDNPFALAVLAHLRSVATSRNPRKRRREKEHLTIKLHESGLPQETMVDLQRFLELVMPLPIDLEREYQQAVKDYERRTKVPVLTQWEKMARQEGRQEGQQEIALKIALDLLDDRFSQAPASLREKLTSVSDPAKLQQIVKAISRAESLAEVEHALDVAKR